MQKWLKAAYGFLKEIHLTAFIIFFRTGGGNLTPAMNVGKGIAGVVLIECALLLALMAWLQVLAGRKTFLEISKWEAIFTYLVLGFANYYALIRCQRGCFV